MNKGPRRLRLERYVKWFRGPGKAYYRLYKDAFYIGEPKVQEACKVVVDAMKAAGLISVHTYWKDVHVGKFIAALDVGKLKRGG